MEGVAAVPSTRPTSKQRISIVVQMPLQMGRSSCAMSTLHNLILGGRAVTSTTEQWSRQPSSSQNTIFNLPWFSLLVQGSGRFLVTRVMVA